MNFLQNLNKCLRAFACFKHSSNAPILGIIPGDEDGDGGGARDNGIIYLAGAQPHAHMINRHVNSMYMLFACELVKVLA